METVFAKSHRSELRSCAKRSIVFRFDVGALDEAIAGDRDVQFGKFGSVEEFPVLERLQFFVPAE